jgi:hypothetical protein
MTTAMTTTRGTGLGKCKSGVSKGVTTIALLAALFGACSSADSGGPSGSGGGAGSGGRVGTGGTASAGFGGSGGRVGTGGTSSASGGSLGTGGGGGAASDAGLDAPLSGDVAPETAPGDAGDAVANMDVAALDVAGDAGGDGADASPDSLPDGIGDASGLQALLVVGTLPLEGKDLVVKARLELKAGVEVVLDSIATTGMATGKALVVLSASAGLANVNTKFRDVAVPVLTTEPNILPVLGMTGEAASEHDGLGMQTKVSMVPANATHPMAAGLTGDVTVFAAPSRLTFGVPGPGALTIASVLGMPAQITIFSYASGSMMVGRTAPAKRVLFFLHDSDPTVALTDDGLRLLDAAIDWSLVP